LNRGVGQKIPLHHKLVNLPLSVIARNHLSVDRMQLLDLRFINPLWIMTSPSKCVVMFSIAAPFQVPIWVGCTPYFFASFDNVMSSRIASSATLALKSSSHRLQTNDCRATG